MTESSRERAVVEFDHHTDDYVRRKHEIYADLRAQCPVGWSERHGGYWVVTRYEDVWAAMRDHETFSSKKWQDEDGRWHGGDVIPEGQSPPLYPLDLDPPEWNWFRRVLNPWLAPGMVDARRDRFRAYATELLDRVIEKGRFDLILDFGNPMPALATLDLVGLPFDEWHRWAEPHHAIQYASAGTPQHVQAMQDLMWQRQQLCAEIASRRTSPRDDLLTAVAQADVDGRPMTDEEGAALVQTVIGGGVDTTTATVANGLLHLFRHPEQRAWILEDIDSRLPDAVEEFLRVYPPVLNVCRTVQRDSELGGQQLGAGDRVALPVVSANRDETAFDDAGEVRLDRFPNRHVTFGLGIHRCVGSNAARAMLHTMIGEVLRRMPDYAIVEDQAIPYGPNAVVDGYIRMPATFTPGRRVGSGISIP